jgi:hypothetical protein
MKLECTGLPFLLSLFKYTIKMFRFVHPSDEQMLNQVSAFAGSASIPEASIPYRYRIELVSIARIDTESI